MPIASRTFYKQCSLTISFLSCLKISSAQSLRCVQLVATPWNEACQAFLSFTIPQSLLKLMAIESVMLSNHLVLCHHLLLPSVFPSIRVFSNEMALLIRWSKYWSFSISPSSDCSGLISFRIDWFDLHAVQGTLKSLRPHQFNISSKESILWCSAFFIVQLSNPYMTTGKNSFDQTGLCQQSNVCFSICCLFLSQVFYQGASVF